MDIWCSWVFVESNQSNKIEVLFHCGRKGVVLKVKASRECKKIVSSPQERSWKRRSLPMECHSHKLVTKRLLIWGPANPFNRWPGDSWCYLDTVDRSNIPFSSSWWKKWQSAFEKKRMGLRLEDFFD
ncbi:hypothetical protein DPMN_047674 [Dreissena polymorpha]|uniref:Uncharacterized protein n=1 Tax=Dreissena polymorpha TaxID=45954 RepID=A0A9D4D854_DREPO|nr:hypothetical protein DPMN_047674 [Dreissena polymorpha]